MEPKRASWIWQMQHRGRWLGQDSGSVRGGCRNWRRVVVNDELVMVKRVWERVGKQVEYLK